MRVGLVMGTLRVHLEYIGVCFSAVAAIRGVENLMVPHRPLTSDRAIIWPRLLLYDPGPVNKTSDLCAGIVADALSVAHSDARTGRPFSDVRDIQRSMLSRVRTFRVASTRVSCFFTNRTITGSCMFGGVPHVEGSSLCVTRCCQGGFFLLPGLHGKA